MSRAYHYCKISPERPGPIGFGPRLVRLRMHHGLDRTALAAGIREKFGGQMTAVSIEGWEKGDYYPSYWSLVYLSRYFKISIDELLDNTVNQAA